jgi:hypothetical protein
MRSFYGKEWSGGSSVFSLLTQQVQTKGAMGDGGSEAKEEDLQEVKEEAEEAEGEGLDGGSGGNPTGGMKEPSMIMILEGARDYIRKFIPFFFFLSISSCALKRMRIHYMVSSMHIHYM